MNVHVSDNNLTVDVESLKPTWIKFYILSCLFLCVVALLFFRRTGRAGNHGFAYTFISPDQGRMAGEIIKALELSNVEVPSDLLQLWEDYKKIAEAVSKQNLWTLLNTVNVSMNICKNLRSRSFFFINLYVLVIYIVLYVPHRPICLKFFVYIYIDITHTRAHTGFQSKHTFS